MKRIGWVDIAKGIGMFCVIFSHMTPRMSMAWQFFNSFHMPLFFFISGYLYKRTDEFSFDSVLRKRFDSLIIPYVVYSFLFLVVFFVDGSWSASDVGANLKDFFKGNGIQVTWFLMVLFLVELSGAVILSRIEGIKCLALVVVVCVVCGFGLNCCDITNVFRVKSIPYALSFWLIGYITKKVNAMDYFGRLRIGAKIALLLFCICVCGLFKFNVVELHMGQMGNPIVSYPVALSFVWLIICLANTFAGSLGGGGLAFVGRYSLMFMCLHELISPVVTLFASILGVDFTISREMMFFRRIVNISILFALSWFIGRFVPLFNGRLKVLRK